MSYQGTTSNNEITEEGSTNNNNEITEEEDNSQAPRSVLQAQQHHSPQEFTALPLKETGAVTSLSTESGGNINHEDDVTLFIAYDGEWVYDSNEWFFENSKCSIMVVPKHIKLSEITDTLNKQFKVNRELYHLKFEVYYITGSPWFHVTEIQNDEDLSVFISETLKTRLPLCVSRSLAWDARAKVDGERRKGTVKIFVAYEGKWEDNREEWFFINSRWGKMLDVPKDITLSEITDILHNEFYVHKKYYRLKLEVHYRIGSPWFPIIGIENDRDLSHFISETSKTKVPLCVTPLEANYVPDVDEQRRKDDTVENRLLKAIRKNDWVKAREIVNNTEEVTWTSQLDEIGRTAFHYAVGEYKNNEVVKDIVMWIDSELLLTIVDARGMHPVHTAAMFGNIEALKIMLKSNPKCSFIPHYGGDLAINFAIDCLEIETFQYLFKQMQSYKDEFDTFLRGDSGLELLIGQVIDKGLIDVAYELKGYKDEFDTFLRRGCSLERLGKLIDTGLIDVAYELIKYNPTMAAEVLREDGTLLQRIIRKPELFYSGTDYNLYQRFVYRNVSIENISLDSSNTTDIENKSLGGTDTADEENQETRKKDKSVTDNTRRCHYDVISMIWDKLWKKTLQLVLLVKHLKDEKVQHNTTVKLLDHICKEVGRSYKESDILRLYSSTFCLAVENNTAEAIHVMTTYFEGLYGSEKDGKDIYQLTVLNRSEKVYNFIMNHRRDAKSEILEAKDYDGSNNILHLAGLLAPIHKLNAASGAALQMQKELQWFEELKRVVGIAQTRELNDNKETPIMVFRREHEKLRKDGEEWMKKTADSYTITAALIITIVFAAAITVPGGNDSTTGKPMYQTKSSLIIFAISDAISLFTSTTSLLLFLSILTARYADEDFLYKLPKRLIIGLVMLFVSVTSMMIAFGATLYIMFGQEKQWILIPIGALACLPIASFVSLQFPLLVELISSTYGHGMFGKEKDHKKSKAIANKEKRA